LSGPSRRIESGNAHYFSASESSASQKAGGRSEGTKPGAGKDYEDDGHDHDQDNHDHYDDHESEALVVHFVRSSLDIALPRIKERDSDGQVTQT
jgi:hypothetical protein